MNERRSPVYLNTRYVPKQQRATLQRVYHSHPPIPELEHLDQEKRGHVRVEHRRPVSPGAFGIAGLTKPDGFRNSKAVSMTVSTSKSGVPCSFNYGIASRRVTPWMSKLVQKATVFSRGFRPSIWFLPRRDPGPSEGSDPHMEGSGGLKSGF